MGNCMCLSDKMIYMSSEVNVPSSDSANPKPIYVRQLTREMQKMNLIQKNKLKETFKYQSGSDPDKIETKPTINNNTITINDKPITHSQPAINKTNIDLVQSQSTIEQYSRSQTTQSPSNKNNSTTAHTSLSHFDGHNDQRKLLHFLKEHYIFFKYDEAVLKEFCSKMGREVFNSNEGIELKDRMMIIKSGKVQLRDVNDHGKIMILSSSDSFGESLLYGEDVRLPYTAIALSNIEGYVITYEQYQILVKENMSMIKESEEEDDKIEDRMLLIESSMLMNHIDIRQKRLFAMMMIFVKMTMKKVVYGKMNKLKLSPDKELRYYKMVFVLKQGSMVMCSIENNTQVHEGDIIGGIQMVLYPSSKIEYELHLQQDCDCYLIPEKNFIEVFGLNYVDVLLTELFFNTIKQSECIMGMLGNTDLRENSVALYKKFHLRQYYPNEIVIPRHAIHDKTKYAIVLKGIVINSKGSKEKDKDKEKEKDKTTISPLASFLGDDYLRTIEELEYDVTALTNSLVLECSWNDMKEVFKSLPYNHTKFYHYNHLSQCRIVSFFNETQIFSLAEQISLCSYSKNDIIFKQDSLSQYVYLLSKGRVKLKERNKTIRVYDKGSSFGERSIFMETNNLYDAIANKTTTCIQIEKKLFLDLMQNQRVYDYIRHKMIIESMEIEVNDLYHLSYLGRGKYGNVCLVHNTYGFYAAKAISKPAAEKHNHCPQYLLHEKKTMLRLDSPFIVKLVKTLKLSSWCFFLEEYIPGINFQHYLNSRKSTSLYNTQETRFYSANIFLMIQYLERYKIVHRDIKPSNIMLDYNGYLKLIDFGSAKKLKNFSYSFIGTPYFIAPEIVVGKGYSFPCDYWSVGICIYLIYYGVLPFGNKSKDVMAIYKEVTECELKFPNENNNSEVNNLIKGLLCKKPLQRIKSFNEVKEVSFFKNFPWKEMKSLRMKPVYLPERDNRDRKEDLQKKNRPFLTFMENESVEIKQRQSLTMINSQHNDYHHHQDIYASPEKNNPNHHHHYLKSQSNFDAKWFDMF